MVICIDGRRFDTSKAKAKFSLDYFDNSSNLHTGTLYMSSKGTWYCYTPSQWANGHRWELVDPQDAIEWYGHGLESSEIAEILALAGLETE